MQVIYRFLFNLLRQLLNLLVLLMILGIVLAAAGFVLATVGVIGSLISLATSGTTVTVSMILGVPVFGNLIIIGLTLVLVGIVIFLASLTLYLLVDLIISQLPRLLPIRDLDLLERLKSVLQTDELRCLFAPLVPAGVMLLLTIPVALFLFLALNRNGLGLENPGAQTLIIAVVVMLCVFGILLALVPIIWCCCCKCRKDGGLSKLLDPFFAALATFVSDGADVIEQTGNAVGNVEKTFNDLGDKFKSLGEKFGNFGTNVPGMPKLSSLSRFVALPNPPPDVPNPQVLNGPFDSKKIEPLAGRDEAKEALIGLQTFLQTSNTGDLQTKYTKVVTLLRSFATLLRNLTP